MAEKYIARVAYACSNDDKTRIVEVAYFATYLTLSDSSAVIQRQTMLASWKQHEDDKKKQLTYPNQQQAAHTIVDHFNKGSRVVVLAALPGSGKTGTSLQVAYDMTTYHNNAMLVPRQHVIFICGLSDKDWVETFKKELPAEFRHHVYHRGQLDNENVRVSLKQIIDEGNVLIVLDEAHVANGKDQSVSKTLKSIGVLSEKTLHEKRICLLAVSATPERIVVDLRKWNNDLKAPTVFMEPALSYKGFKTMLDEKRIIENSTADITDAYVKEWLTTENHRFNSPKYFIWRVNNKQDEAVLTKACDSLGIGVRIHTSNERFANVDKAMSNAPQLHTVIIIRGFWRASKRPEIKHVGATYEKSPKKQNTTATAQGLTGRFCNTYDYEGDWTDPSQRPHHYCNKVAIEEYLAAWDKGFDPSLSSYTSSNYKTKGDGSKPRGRKTFVHPENVVGVNEETWWVLSNTFGSFDAVKVFLRSKFPEVAPHKPHKVGEYELSTRLKTYYKRAKEELTSEDRLCLDIESYKIPSKTTNVSKTEKGQAYMIYPVYPTKTSTPSDVRYLICYYDSEKKDVLVATPPL